MGGVTALMLAVAAPGVSPIAYSLPHLADHVALTRLLVDARANLNIRDSEGCTALHHSIATHDTPRNGAYEWHMRATDASPLPPHRETGARRRSDSNNLTAIADIFSLATRLCEQYGRCERASGSRESDGKRAQQQRH